MSKIESCFNCKHVIIPKSIVQSLYCKLKHKEVNVYGGCDRYIRKWEGC